MEELADREEGFKPDGAVPFKSIIPLSEIISHSMGINQLYSKKVWGVYTKLVDGIGSEFAVLLDASLEQLKQHTDDKIAEAIVNVRDGKIKIMPGYDGEYGYPVFGEEVKKEPVQVGGDRQKSLMDFG